MCIRDRNERLWREENDADAQIKPTSSSGELRGQGISTAGIEQDLAGAEAEAEPEAPTGGASQTPQQGGAPVTPPGGTPTPGA